MSRGRRPIQGGGRAPYLLEATDLPTDEIAGQVGFGADTSLRPCSAA